MKVFDRVPHRVVWWAMRKLGVDEWLVKIVQSMYTVTEIIYSMDPSIEVSCY